jgi:hypothetical protein
VDPPDSLRSIAGNCHWDVFRLRKKPHPLDGMWLLRDYENSVKMRLFFKSRLVLGRRVNLVSRTNPTPVHWSRFHSLRIIETLGSTLGARLVRIEGSHRMAARMNLTVGRGHLLVVYRSLLRRRDRKAPPVHAMYAEETIGERDQLDELVPLRHRQALLRLRCLDRLNHCCRHGFVL